MPKPSENSPIMNVPQASQYLGVGADLLYELAARDEIPHFHVGRYLRFHRDELDKWAKSHHHQRLVSTRLIRRNAR